MVNKTYFKKIGILFALAVIVLPALFGLFSPPAHAATPPVPSTGAWIDRTYIKAGDKYFRPAQMVDYADTANTYLEESVWSPQGDEISANDVCGPVIRIKDFDKDGTKATYENKYKASDGTCSGGGPTTDITLSNQGTRFVTGYVLSNVNDETHHGTIFLPIYKRSNVGGAGFGFVGSETTSTNGYFENRPVDANLNPNQFDFFSGGKWFGPTDENPAWITYDNRRLHTNDTTYDITFANNGNPTDPATLDSTKYTGVVGGAASGNFGSDSTPTGLETKLDCEANVIGSVLGGVGSIVDSAISWIICPLIDGAVGIVNQVGNAVIDQLIINPAVLEGSATASAIRSAWNDFRIISLSLLILVAMVGIAAGSFIDAYTIKKVLPRMLIAIIAITLSWDLMKLALDVTNAVGIGVRALIEAPFRGLPNATIDPVGVLAGIGITGGIFGLLGTFAFVGTAALAVIIAFIVVAIRYVAIIAFIIISPIAIMSSILPGTQKLWKIWHEGLSGALLMLPIVTGMLAIGASLGKVVAELQGGAFGQMMALIVTFGPYFIIPKAFSMAGGLIGNLSGMANDRGRGAFDRLKKFRQNEAHKAWERKKTGNWFRGGNETNLRGRLNKRMMQGTMINEAGFNPKRWKENMDHAVGEREAVESEEIMKSPIGRMLQDDDIASALIDANGDEAAMRRILQERAYKRFGGEENKGALDAAVAGAMRLNRKYGAGGVRIAALRSKFNSSTGWNNEWEYETEDDGAGGRKFVLDEKGEKKIAKDENGNNKIWKYTAAGEMLNDINKVAGSNRVFSTQLLAEARAGQSRAGREDTGGGGFSDTAVEMDKLWRGDAVDVLDDKGDVVWEAPGKKATRTYTVEDATEKVTESLINGKPIQEVFRSGKPAVARAVAPVLKKKTQTEIKAAAARAEKAISQIPVGTPDADRATIIQRIQAREEEETVRALAQEQMMHAVAAQSSQDSAKEMGDSVFNTQFPLETLPPSVLEKVTARYDYVPATETDPNYIVGAPPQDQPKKRIKVGNVDTMTRGQVYEALRSDPTWGAYTKEYGQAAAQAAQFGAAAAAVAAGAEAAGAEPPPGGAPGAGG